MGDLASLVQDASHVANVDKREKPSPILGESISFGRFLSETLDWGKWSTFTHNKYLEDAEKYKTPGLVAQKKAYFEAHYKKTGRRPTGFLIKQTNLTTCNVNNVQEANLEEVQNKINSNSAVTVSENRDEIEGSEKDDSHNVDDRVKMGNDEIDFSVIEEESHMDENKNDWNNIRLVESDPMVHTMVHSETESCNMNVKNEYMEKSPSMVKSSYESDILSLTSRRIQPSASKSLSSKPSRSPLSPINQTKENNKAPPPNLIEKKKMVYRTPFHLINSAEKNRLTPSSTPFHQRNVKEKSQGLLTEKKISPSLKSCMHNGYVHYWKNSLSRSKKGTSSPQEKGSDVKVGTKEDDKPEKSKGNSVQVAGCKKEGESNSRIPNFKQLRSTSSKVCANHSMSRTVPSPFSFRTDERAAKRKEYFLKLEEKWKVEKAEKLLLQENSKKKDETERRTLCRGLVHRVKDMEAFREANDSTKNPIKKSINKTIPKRWRFQ